MADSQNWRTEVDAGDYFLHQKKQLELADRRPVIRKASDLVGPGIDANAVRVTDWNDPLATFDGFFSSVRAAHGPNVEEVGPDAGFDVAEYVGVVSSDAETGGFQMLTRVSDGAEFRRSFRRAPYSPGTITWDPWQEAGALAAYPVGSVFMSINDTDPGLIFGGTWVPWAQGKVVIGVDPSDVDYIASEMEGGSKTKTLNGSHLGLNTTLGTGVPDYGLTISSAFRDRVVVTSGTPVPVNVVQPYITAYMFLRTA